MLELRKMNQDDVIKQWEYVTALPADENGLTNKYNGISFEEYRDVVLPEMMMYETPVDMPEWFVPESFFYLWNGNDIVGEFRIRHYLTEILKMGAGHIGYSVKKEFRGKGYGTKGLALTIDVAWKIIVEDEIYFRVMKNNIPSFKAISNNGAYIAAEDNTYYYMRIKK